jgi:hypothetical protein
MSDLRIVLFWVFLINWVEQVVLWVLGGMYNDLFSLCYYCGGVVIFALLNRPMASG